MESGGDMDAIEFVKKFGLDEAMDLVNRNKTSIGYLSVEHHNLNQDDLKQIIEAFEMVKKRGGLAEAKAVEQQYWNSGVGSAMIVSMELKQAIELVEKVNASD